MRACLLTRFPLSKRTNKTELQLAVDDVNSENAHDFYTDCKIRRRKCQIELIP